MAGHRDSNFSITKLTRSAPTKNGALFQKIKNKILGKKYRLSLVFTTPSHSRKLNLIYRNKDKIADILSFSLEKDEGEIFIVPTKAKEKLLSLYIHGLCHLKGMRHGSRMESEEKKWRDILQLE